MPEPRLDLRPVAAVRVRDLGKYLKFIAEHDLWDEMEQHLKDRGATRVLMSWEVLHAIAGVAEAKAAQLVGTGPGGAFAGDDEVPAALGCASNGSNKPPPKTPPPK